MENTKDCEPTQGKELVNQLTQGKELVNQLRFHLSPTSSTGEFLIEKILSSFNNALFMLNWNGSEPEQQVAKLTAGMIESPQSGSPRSEDSDIRDVYKKRKSMPRWTEQVRVTSGTGIEGSHEDGHSWRKYGQKDILGAKYPRSYYRCTHRHVQGCLATKQVQRSDEDPLVFDVTYRGKHTCNQTSPLMQATQALGKQEQKQNQVSVQEQRKRKQSEELLQKFRDGLRVKTENHDTTAMASSSFSFHSTTAIEYIKSDNIFSSMPIDSSHMSSYSSFISPTTSESNYFSPCHMNIGGGSNFQTAESDLHEIISATTSASNSPVFDIDFSLDFDSNFPFDSPNFFN